MSTDRFHVRGFSPETIGSLSRDKVITVEIIAVQETSIDRKHRTDPLQRRSLVHRIYINVDSHDDSERTRKIIMQRVTQKMKMECTATTK